MKQKDTFYSILLKNGWLLSKKNHNTIILFVVINLFAYFALFVGYFSNGFVYRLVSLAVAVLFSFWATQMIISISNSEQVSISNVFGKIKNIDKFIVTTIIYIMIVSLGLVLFVIPGWFFSIKYILAPYFAVDGHGVRESFKLSAEKTKGYKFEIFVTFFFLSAVINLVFLGVLSVLSSLSSLYLLIGVFVLFVLSLLVIIPWYFGIMAILYSFLNKKDFPVSTPALTKEIETNVSTQSDQLVPQPIEIAEHN